MSSKTTPVDTQGGQGPIPLSSSTVPPPAERGSSQAPSLASMGRRGPPSLSGVSVNSQQQMEASFMVEAWKRNAEAAQPGPPPPTARFSTTTAPQLSPLGGMANTPGAAQPGAGEVLPSGSRMPEGSFFAIFAPGSELQDGVEEPGSYSLAHCFPGGSKLGSRRLTFAPYLLRLARSLGKEPGVPGALKTVDASFTVQRTGLPLVVSCAQLGSWVFALGLPERLCSLRQVGGLAAMLTDMCFYSSGPTSEWREDNTGGPAARLRPQVLEAVDKICGRVFGQLLFRLPLVPGCLASAAFEGAVPHLPTDPEVRLALYSSLAQAEVLLPPLEEALSGSVRTSAFRECCVIHGGRVVASNLTGELTDAVWTVCLSEGFFLREPSHPPLMHTQDLYVHTSAAQTKDNRGLPEDRPAALQLGTGARNLADDPTASKVRVILAVAGMSTTLACMILYPEEEASSLDMDLSWELDVLLATAQDARQHLVEGWFDRRVLALDANVQGRPPQVLDLIHGRPHPWNADAGPDPLLPFAYYEENFDKVKVDVQRSRQERGEAARAARTPPRGRSPANSPPVSPPRSPRSRSGSPLPRSKPQLRYPALAEVEAYVMHDPNTGALYGSGPAQQPEEASGASTPRKKAQERRTRLEDVQLLFKLLPDLRKRFLMTEARTPAAAAAADRAFREVTGALQPLSQNAGEELNARESVSLTLDQLMDRVRSSVAALEGPGGRKGAKAAAPVPAKSSKSVAPAVPPCLPRSALFRVAGKERLKQEHTRFWAKEGHKIQKNTAAPKPLKEEDVFPALEDAEVRWVSAHYDPATGREAYALHAWIDEPDHWEQVFSELVLMHT